METAFKWLGGAALVAGLALGGLAFAGVALSDDVDARGDQAAVIANKTFAPLGAVAAKIQADAERQNDEAFTVKRVLPIDGPMKYGEWHWNTQGAPVDGKLVVTVDLDARVISVFRDGYEIGAAVAMLGTEEHPTPLGRFPILTKERHNVSEKYGNAPMPWTLRLTWDGIAIHGGSEVENGYASHGCIAVPDEFADALFDIAQKGDVVIITRGQRLGMGDKIV